MTIEKRAGVFILPRRKRRERESQRDRERERETRMLATGGYKRQALTKSLHLSEQEQLRNSFIRLWRCTVLLLRSRSYSAFSLVSAYAMHTYTYTHSRIQSKMRFPSTTLILH